MSNQQLGERLRAFAGSIEGMTIPAYIKPLLGGNSVDLAGARDMVLEAADLADKFDDLETRVTEIEEQLQTL